MYAYIKGKYVQALPQGMILENNGIGYLIHLARPFQAQEGEEIFVYTYFHVREDEQSLYGFDTAEEKQLFELLLSVNGIGPKLGLQILAQHQPDRFAAAILHNDVKTLTRAKGLGKKGAERLIVELKDKMKTRRQEVMSEPSTEGELPAEELSHRYGEVLDALLVLGFNRKDALSRLEKSYDETKDVETNVRHALKGFDRSHGL